MDDRHFGCLHHKIPKKDHWARLHNWTSVFFCLFWRNFAIFSQRNWIFFGGKIFLFLQCKFNYFLLFFFFWGKFRKKIRYQKNEKKGVNFLIKKNPTELQTPDVHQQNLVTCMHEFVVFRRRRRQRPVVGNVKKNKIWTKFGGKKNSLYKINKINFKTLLFKIKCSIHVVNK